MEIEGKKGEIREKKGTLNTQECICSVCGKRSIHPLFSCWLCNSCRNKIAAEEMRKQWEIRPGML